MTEAERYAAFCGEGPFDDPPPPDTDNGWHAHRCPACGQIWNHTRQACNGTHLCHRCNRVIDTDAQEAIF